MKRSSTAAARFRPTRLAAAAAQGGLLSLLGVLIAPAALAQSGSTTAPAAASSDSQSITITATLRREPAQNVPSSVAVVEPGELNSKGIYDINGIADLIPNFKPTSGGSPSFGGMTIRGLSSGSAPTVGIYVDDVPYGPVIGGAGSSLALDGSLFDIRRIEVVRGPQGTLFGAGSMGGVVRYISDAPVLSGVEGNAFVDVSRTSHGGSNMLARGKVTFGVVDKTFGLSASAFDSRPDGYIDHPLRNATKVNGSTWNGGMVSGLFAPSKQTSLRVSYLRHQATYDSSGTEGFNPQTGALLLGKPYTDVSSLPTPRKLTFELGWATLEHDFGAATLTAVASDQTLKFSNQTDLTANFAPIADALAPGGAPHKVGFVSAFETRRSTAEVRLASPRSRSFEWLLGAYYTSQRSQDIQNILPVPADIDLLTSSNPTRYKESALFGNLTWYFTPQWDATAGVRAARNEVSLQSNATGLLVTALAPSTTSDSVQTYMFNTRYRVDRELSLYARAASGYRPAGVNLLTRDTQGRVVGIPSYKSDSLWSYEAGAKGTLMNRRLKYDVSVYHVDWKRTQIAVTFASGLSGQGNAVGGVRANGLELSLSGEVVPNFTLTGTLGLSNAKLKSNEAALGGLAGERLPGAPKTSASLLGDYRLALGQNIAATVGATWRYTGTYNSSFVGGGGIAPPQPNFTNPAFSQFDLRAGLQSGAWSGNLYVTNLSDKRAYQSVLGFAPTYAQGVLIRPRTVGVNVRYEFL